MKCSTMKQLTSVFTSKVMIELLLENGIFATFSCSQSHLRLLFKKDEVHFTFHLNSSVTSLSINGAEILIVSLLIRGDNNNYSDHAVKMLISLNWKGLSFNTLQYLEFRLK